MANALRPAAALRPWLLATRPKTLAAGIAPVAVGLACASTAVTLHWGAALASLLGAVLIQIGCNFANDAFDALKGADTAERVGPTRAVASGLISPRAMLIATAVVLGLATVVGLYLATVAGWPIFVLGLVCLVCAVAYTGGPLPLAYVGLGDLFVLVFFGLVAVLGTAHVQIQATALALGGIPLALVHGELVLGLPVLWWCAAAGLGFQATAIICANNLRDIATDGPVGKRTVCVRLGDGPSRWYYGLLHSLAAASFAAGIAFAGEPLRLAWVVAAALAFIGGQSLSRIVRHATGAALNRVLALSAGLELVTAVAFVITLILSQKH